MLIALPKTRQNEGESKRAWYFSSSLDMFVWFDGLGAPYAFDLSYKTRRYQERTVSWHLDRGYRHWKAETGRQRFGSGAILVQDGAFDRSLVAAQFLAQCVELPLDIIREVLNRLAAFALPAGMPERSGVTEEGESDANQVAASA